MQLFNQSHIDTLATPEERVLAAAIIQATYDFRDPSYREEIEQFFHGPLVGSAGLNGDELLRIVKKICGVVVPELAAPEESATAVCLNCGKPMEKRSVVQLYCTTRCRQAYYRTHERARVEERWKPITFKCARCGREVTTEPGTGDRRTRFCGPQCEKRYYRHPPWEVRQTSVWANRPPRQPRIFVCAECGKKVVTDTDRIDNRRRFCCREHCAKFWGRLENKLEWPSVQRKLTVRERRLSIPFVCKTCGKTVIPAEMPEARLRTVYCSAACAGRNRGSR